MSRLGLWAPLWGQGQAEGRQGHQPMASRLGQDLTAPGWAEPGSWTMGGSWGDAAQDR